MQQIIALGMVGLAVIYLIYRALRKGKPGCDCGCCRGEAKKLP